MKDTEKAVVKFELRQFITYRISRLQNSLNAQAGHVLSKLSDLTLTEWRILYILRSMSTATMSQIVQESRLDKAQSSRSIMMRRQEAMTEGLSDEDIKTFLRILDHLDETALRRDF